MSRVVAYEFQTFSKNILESSMTPHITPTRGHVQNDLNAETTGNIEKALPSRSYAGISM
jgi:hypothetical protein